MDKIRRNVHQLSSSTLKTRSKIESVIDVTNIGSLEMHAIKPFVTEAFRLHRELSGKGSSYNQDVEPDNSSGGGGGGGNAGGDRRSGAASAGRGRLQQSRLVRESENNAEQLQSDEELLEPRPSDEMASSGEEDEDDNAGRSNLRRHR